jgi:hypothetical protein
MTMTAAITAAMMAAAWSTTQETTGTHRTAAKYNHGVALGAAIVLAVDKRSAPQRA